MINVARVYSRILNGLRKICFYARVSLGAGALMGRIAVLSCAGVGNRFGLGIPKCMLNFAGKTILSRALHLLHDFDEVRVIVGYREEDVISEASKCRETGIKFIRNSIYGQSSNAYSLYLATRDINESFLIFDGDVIVFPEDFKRFLNLSAEKNTSLLTVTKVKTEMPIYAALDTAGRVINFSLDTPSLYEWTGIGFLRRDVTFSKDGNFACDEIAKELPLPSCVIDSYEIDTPSDYKRALVAVEMGGYG